MTPSTIQGHIWATLQCTARPPDPALTTYISSSTRRRSVALPCLDRFSHAVLGGGDFFTFWPYFINFLFRISPVVVAWFIHNRCVLCTRNTRATLTGLIDRTLCEHYVIRLCPALITLPAVIVFTFFYVPCCAERQLGLLVHSQQWNYIQVTSISPCLMARMGGHYYATRWSCSLSRSDAELWSCSAPSFAAETPSLVWVKKTEKSIRS